jgi:ADP-heptose:LPS heptosyltransferase
MSRDLHVLGMHGMGDCIHARAVIRQLVQRHERVWLETPWPCLYHDLAAPNKLMLINKVSSLRTQRKNAEREARAFSKGRPPGGTPQLRIWYPPDYVRQHGSVLGAMLAATKLDPDQYDFTLPLPDAWQQRADALIKKLAPGKPILIYRPLVLRPEWQGCAARNPDFAAYCALFDLIRDDFFCISVADLVPKIEWLVGGPMPADARFHHGELDVEILAALTQRAALTFASPGFMVPLSQALGVPSVCVFGGYENGSSFSLGAKLAPHLAIEPINPCACFMHTHQCDKRIDMPLAEYHLRNFIAEYTEC